MSVIHYRFASAEKTQMLTFEGLGLTVREVRTAILTNNKLMKNVSDIQLILSSDAATEDELVKEDVIIPKNTNLIVKRMPARLYPKRTIIRGLPYARPPSTGRTQPMQLDEYQRQVAQQARQTQLAPPTQPTMRQATHQEQKQQWDTQLRCQCGQFYNHVLVFPCCNYMMCQECATQALLDTNECGNCHEKNMTIDKLKHNATLQRKVDRERRK